MKKILLILLLISQFLSAQWSIPNSERDALISIYNSTNGEKWSTGWNLDKDPKTWYGIKTRNGLVTEINLRGNALKGNFPTLLSSFTKLEKLDLSSNQLTGGISPGISGLSDLKRLDLSYNNLTGDPSLTLSSLSNLEELSLGNNSFTTNDINGFLQSFTKIKTLDLSNFGLTEIPTKLSIYTKLEVVNLSNNAISKNYNIIGNLINLSDLDLSGNKLMVVPSELSTNTNLKTLNLSNNLFSKNYSSTLSFFKNLEWLSLENNQIDVIPQEILQLKKLIHLNLGRNKLSNGLSTLVNLNNLEQIFLNNNYLSGAFPSELLQLPKLQMLSLSSNNFSGTIPNNVPALTFIENNKFTEQNINTFLSTKNSMADFVYSPQRYDDTTTVFASLGSNANLTQSLSGEDYSFKWFKTLENNMNVTSINLPINSVKNSDYDQYTCEAYYLKNNPNYLMEVSFFREIITLDNSLATEEVSKNLTIYPNPTSDFINIQSNNLKIENSTIYDLSGKRLLQSKDLKINVKYFPSGVYLIVIKTDKFAKTIKWIKE